MKNPVLPKIVLILLVILFGSCSARKSMISAGKSYEIGEHYNAIEKYRKAYRSQKVGQEKAEMAFRIAESYFDLSEFAKASIWYKNAIKRNYSEPKCMLHYADCLRAVQKYEDAIIWYQTYLSVKPGDQFAENGLEASKVVREWLDQPNRYIVNIVRELNSKDNDYCPVFVAGRDNEIILTSTRETATGGKHKSNITGTRMGDLFTSKFQIQKQKWETPELLEENELINTTSDEGAATLSERGDLMIFTRCRFDKSKDLGAELFAANRSRGEWSEPQLIELVGDSLSAAHPSLSADGTNLYFVSDRMGGFGGKDIWMATGNGGSFDNPVNLGPEINTPGDEMFPFIRENGELYFSSNYLPGIGGLDIFKAVKDEKGKWQVENMKAPINSPGDDLGIAFIKGEVEKGLFSSNRKGSRSDDIYSFYLPPKIFNASGEILNKATNQKIDGAMIRIIGTDGTNLKMRADGGRFQYKLKPETEYVFAAFKDGFLNDKARTSTIGLEDSKEFKFQFKLSPTDEPIKVNNINYAFGSYEITEESKAALDTVVQLLTVNPTITIELMAHTDFVGSDQFNSELSQKRAQSVVDYLISKGISSTRLVAKGYGETWPKIVTRMIAKQYDFLKRNDELTEEFILKLTPEQQEIAKALNRRTEFRVLSNNFQE
ncbi:MAG TPA: OmpA family protein [Prolixibacteraceae bacterium]|nr:OmpA family protein [Prolixibacteraceae bacterium]